MSDLDGWDGMRKRFVLENRVFSICGKQFHPFPQSPFVRVTSGSGVQKL